VLKKLLSKKSPPVLGLDIGTRYVKGVLLSRSGEQTQLMAYACEAITGNAFADRDIKDFDAVSNAIRKVKLALRTKCKAVAVAVSGTSVISKVVFMDPDQQDHDLEMQIEVEADSLIPYPLDEVYMDFEELGPSRLHEGKVDVLLTAAHRDMIDNRVTLLRELEFEPKIVDVEGYALGTAVNECLGDSNEKPVCCINIGASQLLITVVDQHQVIYSKEHAFGMDTLIRDLGLIYGMEMPEVEKAIQTGELPADWRQQNWPVFLANLQQQIGRALQMYTTSTGKERPEQLYLAGGCANLPGIAQDLEQELSLPVSLFDPFAEMTIKEGINRDELKRMAPQLAIAAGLAFRSFSSWHI